MKHATPDEYFALLVATLVLIIVLVASFMCIQLYHLRKPGPPPCDRPQPPAGEGGGSKDGFLGPWQPCYAPSCGGAEWIGRRRGECQGLTTGGMPSIETAGTFGGDLCSGMLGVPL